MARLDHPGPMLRNVAPVPHSAWGSWPSPRTMISALAPLSDRNKISVLSSAPVARSWATTRPISASMRLTIAAWTDILPAWKSRCAGVKSAHARGRFSSLGPSFSNASGVA